VNKTDLSLLLSEWRDAALVVLRVGDRQAPQRPHRDDDLTK
jgi:hypothetical protein